MSTPEQPPITEIRVPDYGYKQGRQQTLIKGTSNSGDNLADTVYRYTFDIGEGATVMGYIHSEHPGVLYVESLLKKGRYNQNFWQHWGFTYVDVEEAPFSIEIVSEGHTRDSLQYVPDGQSYYASNWVTKQLLDVYDDPYGETPKIPYIYLTVNIVAGDIKKVAHLRFRNPEVGVLDFEREETEVHTGLVKCDLVFRGFHQEAVYKATRFDTASFLFRRMDIRPTPDALWVYMFRNSRNGKPDLRSLKSIYKRKTIAPSLERMEKEKPLLWRFFRWLHDGRTWNKASNNQLLGVFLKEQGEDYDALITHLRAAMDQADTIKQNEIDYHEKDRGWTRAFCMCLPGAPDKVEAEKAKKQWQFHKSTSAKAEALGVSKEHHPLTLEAIGRGDLPLNLFHEPGNENHLVNVEWDLWERALERAGWGEVLFKLSQNASSRGTYTHHVTSYIAFLFKIERYLDKNAPRPKQGRKKVGWKAMPSFVESQWQLEMDDASEGGTTKKRSALTPVADNDAAVITVPYAAIAIHGRQTTYCYSKQFYVVEEGMNDPDNSGVFHKELEIGLNGRDDYGLMWYTLTGSSRNRGYPTFLVIFERIGYNSGAHGEKDDPISKSVGMNPAKWRARSAQTRVHLHRVHPSRYRGPEGTATPSCKLIQECYRYMAGNVKASDIWAQQGDMIYIRHDNDPVAAGAKVEEPQEGPALVFESHAMIPKAEGATLQLFVSKAKTPKNRLGFVHVPEGGMMIKHPEHEDIHDVPAGWYDVRRARSYENNPVAVWSLTID